MREPVCLSTNTATQVEINDYILGRSKTFVDQLAFNTNFSISGSALIIETQLPIKILAKWVLIVYAREFNYAKRT